MTDKDQRIKDQEEAIRVIFKKYDLEKKDIFRHKNYVIIARSGIEKIQAKADIQVEFELVAVNLDGTFACVKGTGIKGDKTIQTFGSAKYGGGSWEKVGGKNKFVATGNTEQWYIVEMAEKRSLSRVVLKMEGLYEHGFFGEDEADDFTDETQRTELEVPAKPEVPKVPTAKKETTPKKEEKDKSCLELQEDGRYKVKKSLAHIKSQKGDIGKDLKIEDNAYVIVDKSATHWIVIPADSAPAPAEEEVEKVVAEEVPAEETAKEEKSPEEQKEAQEKSVEETGTSEEGINISNVKARLEAANTLDELKDAWKEVCSWGFGKNKEAHDIKNAMKEKVS